MNRKQNRVNIMNQNSNNMAHYLQNYNKVSVQWNKAPQSLRGKNNHIAVYTGQGVKQKSCKIHNLRINLKKDKGSLGKEERVFED